MSSSSSSSSPLPHVFKTCFMVRGYVGSGKTSFCNVFANSSQLDAFSHRPIGETGTTEVAAGGERIKLLAPYDPLRYAKSGKYASFVKAVELETLLKISGALEKRRRTISGNGAAKTLRRLSKNFENAIVQITLVDTSGFDVGLADSLPASMMRSLDGVLWLVSVDPDEMTSGDTAGWCALAHQKMGEKRGRSRGGESGAFPFSALVGTKCDLAFGSKDFGAFETQLCNNAKARSVSSTGKANLVLRDALLFEYWKISPKVGASGFANRCKTLLSTIEKDNRDFVGLPDPAESEEKEEDEGAFGFELTSSITGCCVNRSVYAAAAEALSRRYEKGVPKRKKRRGSFSSSSSERSTGLNELLELASETECSLGEIPGRRSGVEDDGRKKRSRNDPNVKKKKRKDEILLGLEESGGSERDEAGDCC